MSVIVDGLILAGGRSSRMGRDKALIQWGGEPLLHRVGRVASQCCRQISILSPWPDRYRGLVESSWQLGVEEHPDQGPLVGLNQGLQHLGAVADPPEWVLLLACDLPYLQVSILKGWMQQLEEIGADGLALVPYRQDRWEPLCGWYRLSCAASLARGIQAGHRSFQTWLNQIPVQPIPITPEMTLEARMMWNCNTPADLMEETTQP